jgi:hypothetical protein
MSVRQSGWCRAQRSVALRCSSAPCVITTMVQRSLHSTTQHPSASEVLGRCAAEAAELHNVESIAVEHRIGRLEVGDVAVVVAVGAVHREAALAACAHLITPSRPGADLEGTAPPPAMLSGWVWETRASQRDNLRAQLGCRDPPNLDRIRLGTGVHLPCRAPRRHPGALSSAGVPAEPGTLSATWAMSR